MPFLKISSINICCCFKFVFITYLLYLQCIYKYYITKMNTLIIRPLKHLFSLLITSTSLRFCIGVVPIVLLIATIVQYSLGSIPLREFAFPVNLLIGVCFIYLLWLGRNHRFLGEWSSLTATLTVIGLMVVNGLILGLTPQLSNTDALVRNPFAYRLGIYQYTTSWIFVVSVGLFLWVLGSVIVRRTKPFFKHSILFLLSHGGLWLALFAGTFGSADTYQVKLIVNTSHSNGVAFEQNGETLHLPYQLQLVDFRILNNSDENASIKNYEATLRITLGEYTELVTVSVNHPVSFEGDRIYLNAYHNDNEPYCVIQIVRQPWAPVILTGIILLLMGAFYLFISGFRSKNNNYGME